MAIGKTEHRGIITNWRLDDWQNSDSMYYITKTDNEIIDMLELYKKQNPDASIGSLSCNANFIESPDSDIGVIFLQRTKNGLEPVSNFVIPVPMGKQVSDLYFQFDALHIIAKAGTRIRFVANYF